MSLVKNPRGEEGATFTTGKPLHAEGCSMAGRACWLWGSPSPRAEIAFIS